MSETTIGIIGLCVLLLLVFLRMPIGLAMMLVGFAGFAIVGGAGGALNNLNAVPYRYAADFTFAVIPLFLLMGSVAAKGGISEDLYKAAHAWVGRLKGGLAMATVWATAGFAAICGSSTATAAGIGKIAYPEMKKFNYDARLATGSIAAGGTMGILIPPSLGFVTYAILTEQSIGKLFMAGIIPGILEAVFYMITIHIVCKLNPNLGPRGPAVEFRRKLDALKGVWSMIVLFILVMGGIYAGVFTPTEAAGIGATGAMLVSLARGKLSRGSFVESLMDSGRSTATIFLLIIGAMVFQRFIAISNLPFRLADLISGLGLSRYAVLSLIILFYIFAGCFMDIFSCLVLTIPIIYPAILSLGFDPIWFGVIFVRVAEIGLITPPIGMNCFVVAGTTGVPLGVVFRGIVPFIVADVAHVALLVAFPQISLFLPSMMG